MKNQIIILFLTIGTAFGSISCNNSIDSQTDIKDTALLELDYQNTTEEKLESEYYYGIGSRFEAISKTDLHNAVTIFPFNRDHENERIEKVNSTEIIIIEHDKQTDKRFYGNSENLSDSQKELFKSLDYNKHFSMKTLFHDKLIEGETKFNPHYTVVPETEAFYIDGERSIINYLIENSKIETANLDNKKVRPAKIYFTITKKGILENVYMDRTTGYSILDEKLKALISKIPGQWQTAKNSSGELIKQEFTFTFGPKGGC